MGGAQKIPLVIQLEYPLSEVDQEVKKNEKAQRNTRLLYMVGNLYSVYKEPTKN